MRSVILALPLLFISVSSGHADWQYTKWHQSFEDLSRVGDVEASDDEMQNAGNMVAPLKARYSAAGIETTAYFYFDSNNMEAGLVEVGLDVQDQDDCASVVGILDKSYGNPNSKSDFVKDQVFFEFRVWRKVSSGDDVIFQGLISPIVIGYVSCDVVYQPPGVPGAAGGF